MGFGDWLSAFAGGDGEDSGFGGFGGGIFRKKPYTDWNSRMTDFSDSGGYGGGNEINPVASQRANIEVDSNDPSIVRRVTGESAPNPALDYETAYRRMMGQYEAPDMSGYLDPNDPDIKNYRRVIGESTGAKEYLDNYLKNRPNKDNYKPSFLRKLLVGVSAGFSDPKYAEQALYEPYYEKMDEWKDRGKYVDDMTRLMEADKRREVGALEFGVKQKGARARLLSTDRRAAERNANTGANNMGRLTQGQQRLDETAAENDWRHQYLTDKEKNDIRYERDRLEIDRRLAEIRDRLATVAENRPTTHDRTTDPSEILKQDKAADVLARKSAIEELKNRNHPLFKIMRDYSTNPENKGKDVFDFLDEALSGIDPQAASAYKVYLNRLLSGKR